MGNSEVMTTSVLREFASVLVAHKKYWLSPLLILVVIFGGLFLFANGGSPTLRLLYSVF